MFLPPSDQHPGRAGAKILRLKSHNLFRAVNVHSNAPSIVAPPGTPLRSHDDPSEAVHVRRRKTVKRNLDPGPDIGRVSPPCGPRGSLGDRGGDGRRVGLLVGRPGRSVLGQLLLPRLGPLFVTRRLRGLIG